jgi:hypothetical protein
MDKNTMIYIISGIACFFSLIITSLIIYFAISSFQSEPTTETTTQQIQPQATPTPTTTTPTTTQAPLTWTPPSNLNRDDCWDYGRYWFAAGNPPYCDVSKRVDGQYLPKCNIHPSERKPSSLRFNWNNNKTTRWNLDNQAKICTDSGKCFDAKNGSSWCYEPK